MVNGKCLPAEASAQVEKFVAAPPQYTRPEEYKGWKVPSVLLSGDPKKISEWKEEN